MHALAQDPLQNATERSQRYWVSDGIPLIVMGGFWITWGSVLFLPLIFPGRGIVRYMSIIVIAVMALAGILMKPIIQRWKERVTFPRTGYIELRQPGKLMRYGIPVLVGVLAFIIGLLVHFEDRTFREWLPLGLGMMLAAGMLHASWKMRSFRLAIFSTLVAGAGVVAFLMHRNDDFSFGLTMFVAGMCCLAEGALMFYSYLRAHPAPSGDEQ